MIRFILKTDNRQGEFIKPKYNDKDAPKGISDIRNNDEKAVKETLMEKYPKLRDKYNDRDPYRISDRQKKLSDFYIKGLDEESKKLLEMQDDLLFILNHRMAIKKYIPKKIHSSILTYKGLPVTYHFVSQNYLFLNDGSIPPLL